MPGVGEVVARVQTDGSVDAGTRLVGGTVRGGFGGSHAVVVVVEPGVAGGKHEVRGERQPPAPPLGAGSEPPLGAAGIVRGVAQDLPEQIAPFEALLVAHSEIGFGNARGHPRKARRDALYGKALEAMRKERGRALVGPEIELESRAEVCR